MLKDSTAFYRLEKTLRRNGTLSVFEEEQGMVRRRMMITQTEIPEGIDAGPDASAFEATFDIDDTGIGIAMGIKTLTPLSNMWLIMHGDDKSVPDREDAEKFVLALLDVLRDELGFTLPVCTFLSDFGHLSICPPISLEKRSV